MTQDRAEVRIRYRWRWPMPVFGTLILYGCAWLWLGPLREVDGFSPGVSLAAGGFMLVIAIGVTLAYGRFLFRPEFLVLLPDTVEVPNVASRKKVCLRYDTIFEFRTRSVYQRGRSLIILSSDGLASIQQNHLPWGMRLDHVQDLIAQRVEIATGRKLD